MQRITGANTIDLGGGKLGFRDRNLVGGITGTTVLAAWLNSLQEEVAGLIEISGIPLDAGNNNQLLGAVQVQVVQMFNVHSLVTAGYQMMPAGLVLQWGAFLTTTGNAETFLFPIAFPTGVLQMVGSDGGLGIYNVSVAGVDAAHGKVWAGTNPGVSPAYSGSVGVHWLAIGH